MTITKSEAQRVANDYIKGMEPDVGLELVLLEQYTMERDFGWVFLYNSKQYVETGNSAEFTSPNERSELPQCRWRNELSMSLSVENGLVFAIPLAEKMFGVGQLIAWQRPIFYMAGYDMYAESPDVSESDIKNAKPVLLGNFFDILIRNGRWTAIWQQQTPKVPFPCFKIKIEDKFYVESWNRQQIREANSEECAALQFRSNCSAIVLENALKAYFGQNPWESRFDCLKVAEIVKSSRIFKN